MIFTALSFLQLIFGLFSIWGKNVSYMLVHTFYKQEIQKWKQQVAASGRKKKNFIYKKKKHSGDKFK